ncbi:MAG: hypothetical protein NC433_16365 [Clostridiales bacterium]|nr:hypothetical protein [Clostridiales bacterium]
MKNRWKMLVAALGAAALVICQNGVLQVNAEEPETQAANSTPAAVTSLQWNQDTGVGTFTNTNGSDVSLTAYIYYCGTDSSGTPQQVSGYEYENPSPSGADLYHLLRGQSAGYYKFKVVAKDSSGATAESDFSNAIQFEAPTVTLPVPTIDITVTEDSDNNKDIVLINFSINNESYTLGTDYGFYCDIYLNGTRIDQFSGGSNNSSIRMELSGSYKNASIRVVANTLSRKYNTYKDSNSVSKSYPESSSTTTDSPSNNSSSSSSNSSHTSSTETVEEEVKKWEPTTPDEKKRFAVFSTEKATYTADSGNAYSVKIQNALQGPKCFEAFEAVLMDWNIGRTYDILPTGKTVYKMDTKARITLSIPKSLQKEGRAYKMICVTQGGAAVILDDLDADPSTITFDTDTYYAFALIYK